MVFHNSGTSQDHSITLEILSRDFFS